jgi:hypothetical protein
MKIACLFRGNLRENDRVKNKFNDVIKSIHKLFNNNTTQCLGVCSNYIEKYK